MATVVHIPLSELPNAQSLRDRLRTAEEIILEAENESYRFTRERTHPGRTADEMLQLLGPRANVEADDEWSEDMAEIVRENRAHDRDSWA